MLSEFINLHQPVWDIIPSEEFSENQKERKEQFADNNFRHIPCKQHIHEHSNFKIPYIFDKTAIKYCRITCKTLLNTTS